MLIESTGTYTSGYMKAYNSDMNRYIMNTTLKIEIAAPAEVGCVRSLGILR